jgi:hypothetical protein
MAQHRWLALGSADMSPKQAVGWHGAQGIEQMPLSVAYSAVICVVCDQPAEEAEATCPGPAPSRGETEHRWIALMALQLTGEEAAAWVTSEELPDQLPQATNVVCLYCGQAFEAADELCSERSLWTLEDGDSKAPSEASLAALALEALTQRLHDLGLPAGPHDRDPTFIPDMDVAYWHLKALAQEALAIPAAEFGYQASGEAGLAWNTFWHEYFMTILGMVTKLGGAVDDPMWIDDILDALVDVAAVGGADPFRNSLAITSLLGRYYSAERATRLLSKVKNLSEWGEQFRHAIEEAAPGQSGASS